MSHLADFKYDYDLATDPIGDALYEIFEVEGGKVVDYARSVEEALAKIKTLETRSLHGPWSAHLSGCAQRLFAREGTRESEEVVRAPMQEPEVVAALANSAAGLREAAYRFVGSRQSQRWNNVADALLAECEARLQAVVHPLPVEEVGRIVIGRIKTAFAPINDIDKPRGSGQGRVGCQRDREVGRSNASDGPRTAPQGGPAVTARGYENALLRPTKYLRFEPVAVPRGRKTAVWNVRSQSNDAILGTIRWHGPWRQYTFWPTNSTLYNIDCLIEIADRLATCNRWHRNIRANITAREALDAAS